MRSQSSSIFSEGETDRSLLSQSRSCLETLTPRQQGVHWCQGFTLIELLVVIAIIGILASVILAALNTARDKAEVAGAKSELGNIRVAMEILRNDTGVYPNDVDDFCRTTPPADNEVDLNHADAHLTADSAGWSSWDGPYISAAIDPWDTPYYMDEDYECQGTEEGCNGSTNTISAILSCGPDTDNSGAGGSCEYNADNIVIPLCGT